MNIDLVSIIGNLSQSMRPVQTLIAGMGYMIGILLMIGGIHKLGHIAGSPRGGSKEKVSVPIAYFIGGSALIFLPTAITVVSNTAFGLGNNVLQYAQYNPYNIYNAMQVVVKTAGLIWFLRGTVLLVHSSQPNVKGGAKGLVFLCAGVLAMNFEMTAGLLNDVVQWLISISAKA